MGLARFGRLIEYIPVSVTLGFTSGIGITIGTMQIKDFLGLQMAHVPEHYLQKVGALFMALPTINVGDAAIGIVTLGILVFWPRLGIRLPGHLPALLAGCAVMGIVNLLGGHVATIGSQFHYVLADGSQGNGIPQLLPQLVLPWDLPNQNSRLPGFYSHTAACGILNGNARRNRISALRRGAGWYDRDKTQGKQRTGWTGTGKYHRSVLWWYYRYSCHRAFCRYVRAGATSPISAVIHSILVILAPPATGTAALLAAAFRHGSPAVDGGVEHERSAQSGRLAASCAER